jgi:hypothetical protein
VAAFVLRAALREPSSRRTHPEAPYAVLGAIGAIGALRTVEMVVLQHQSLAIRHSERLTLHGF